MRIGVLAGARIVLLLLGDLPFVQASVVAAW